MDYVFWDYTYTRHCIYDIWENSTNGHPTDDSFRIWEVCVYLMSVVYQTKMCCDGSNLGIYRCSLQLVTT